MCRADWDYDKDTLAFFISWTREHGNADVPSPIRAQSSPHIRQFDDLDPPWPRDVAMECCPRLGGPPHSPVLPTRLAPYVARRDTFECYRCERGRSLRVLRGLLRSMAISTPRDCPQHGHRTCVVSFEQHIGRYRCRWVCITAPLRDFDILDCAGDDTVRSSGSGFQPPPRSLGSEI